MSTSDGTPEDRLTMMGGGADGETEPGPAPRMSIGKVGRYKITRLIGEGGMGAVYEAEQDQPRRTVALKVIKPGLASPELLRRFAQESQALGRLQHPGIAQIYDAGTADTGYGPQPYFAMEFIRGETLLDHAKNHHLNTRQRLELLVRVCDAVHHAHQRGLIHRDLKPGNILVDETGQPKILDFGVARVTDSDAQATMQTDVGQLVGTLAYMSPEQVLADPLELDIRSDVYALGVIFYELLSGRLPYNISRKLHEALHAIREEDPSRLSMINRSFRGDIETIAAKALEKDKTRRYASAAELGADISHYLKDEPIIAQPPSTAYQLQKFARRHRGLVIGLAAVFVVLVLGVVAATWQAIRAGRAEAVALVERDKAKTAEETASTERDKAVKAEGQAVASEAQAKIERDKAIVEKKRADLEAAISKGVSEFFRKNIFEQVAGGGQRGNATSLDVAGSLDRAASRIAGTFDKEPLVEAGVREAVGISYVELNLFDKSSPQFERALALRRRVQGDNDAATLKTSRLLAISIFNQRKVDEGINLLARTIVTDKRVLGTDHAETTESQMTLAALYSALGKHDKAEPYALEAVSARSRVLGLSHKDTVTAVLILDQALVPQKKYAVALKWTAPTLEAARRVLNENDPLLTGLKAVQQRAQVELKLVASTDRDAQKQVRDQVLATAAQTIDSLKPTSLVEMMTLAVRRMDVAVAQNRPEDAEAPLLEALDASRRSGREEPALVGYLAGVYALQKKFPLAEATLKKLLDDAAAMKDLPPNVWGFGLRALASTYKNEKRYAEAEPHYIKLISLMLVKPGEREVQTRIDIVQQAENYAAQRKWTDAEKSYTQVSEMQRRLAKDNINTEATVIGLGWAHYQQGHWAEAEKIFRESSAILRRIAANSWERFNLDNILGATLAAQKKFAEAEPLLVSGYEGMLTRTPTTNPNGMGRFTKEQAGEAIVQMYADWGKADKRAEWAEKLKNQK